MHGAAKARIEPFYDLESLSQIREGSTNTERKNSPEPDLPQSKMDFRDVVKAPIRGA